MTADTLTGVWNYSLELIREFEKAGITVSLATMGAPMSARQRFQLSDFERLETFESDYKCEWMSNPWEHLDLAGTWLRHIADRVQPDLIHFNHYAHASLPWDAPTLVAGHSCMLSWWREVKGDVAPPEWDQYRDRVREGLHAAQAVVAPSRAMMEALRQNYGDCQRATVIAHGRRVNDFAPGEKKPFIFCAARLWDEAKNVHALAEAAQGVEWPVYLAGEEWHPEGYRFDVKNIRMLGQLSQDEIARWYAAAAIFALPAMYEPFGLSILEAALAGCALVIGDIPSLREVWGDAAAYVPPWDRAGLRDSINSLIADPASRMAQGRRAHARALELTSERMAADYLRLYRQLLAPVTQRPVQAIREIAPCA